MHVRKKREFLSADLLQFLCIEGRFCRPLINFPLKSRVEIRHFLQGVFSQIIAGKVQTCSFYFKECYGWTVALTKGIIPKNKTLCVSSCFM
jgi:hypothetical protein